MTTSSRRRVRRTSVGLSAFLVAGVFAACQPPAAPTKSTPAVERTLFDTYTSSTSPTSSGNTARALYSVSGTRTQVTYMSFNVSGKASGPHSGVLRLVAENRIDSVSVHSVGALSTATTHRKQPAKGVKVGSVYGKAAGVLTIDLSKVPVDSKGHIHLGLFNNTSVTAKFLSAEGAGAARDRAPRYFPGTTAPTTPTTVAPTTTRPPTTTAPVTTTTRPPATTTTRPTTTTTPGGSNVVYVDESRLLPRNTASYSTPRIGSASYQPRAGDGGEFRTNCRFSHQAFNDPIVFPGQARAGHLHNFYGNTAINGMSTANSIATTGNSTCEGGTANRTAYWSPAVIDTRNGAPVHPGTDAEVSANAAQLYYKAGYRGVSGSDIVNFPAGLRMIAGTASSTTAQDITKVWYSCGPLGTPRTSFPNCAPGELFVIAVEFPQCWDGRNLDSPDHKSHMAYGRGWPNLGCPSTHPVALTQVTAHFWYRVPAGGMSTWRLSSDMYSGPAGYSGHADWFMGWDRNVYQKVVDNCMNPGGVDCQMNLLGDGTMLR